jgi:hypothetical protein
MIDVFFDYTAQCVHTVHTAQIKEPNVPKVRFLRLNNIGSEHGKNIPCLGHATPRTPHLVEIPQWPAHYTDGIAGVG